MLWQIFASAGFLMICLAGVCSVREHRWLQQARISQGEVVALVARSDSDGTTFAPKVRFTAANGVQQEFTSPVASSPPSFKIGQRVAVAYDPADPVAGRLVTFGQRFGVWVIVGSLGVAFFLIGLTFNFGTLIVPGVYLKSTPPEQKSSGTRENYGAK